MRTVHPPLFVPSLLAGKLGQRMKHCSLFHASRTGVSARLARNRPTKPTPSNDMPPPLGKTPCSHGAWTRGWTSFPLRPFKEPCRDLRSCTGQMQRGNTSGRPKQALFSIQVGVRANSAKPGAWNGQLMFLFLMFCHRTSTFSENASAYSPFRRFPLPSFPLF